MVEALEERMVMSTFSVVPGTGNSLTTFGTLHALLTQANVQSGDVIQVEPNSTPGHITDADIPNVQNLTIQGDPTADRSSIPYFFLDTPVFIGTIRQGFTLKHVQFDITNGSLQLRGNSTISDCHVKNDFAGLAIELDEPNAAVVSDSYIESQTPNSTLLTLISAANTHNRITDNQLVGTGSGINLVDCSGIGAGNDLIAHNTFDGNAVNVPMLKVENGSQGLTVQGNTFDALNSSVPAIQVIPNVQNLHIVDNVISFTNGTANSIGISVAPGTSAAAASMVIADNHIHTDGHGIGILFNLPPAGAAVGAKVQDNDLRGNQLGIYMAPGSGGSVAGIDLGGGAQGSLGANDFRGDKWAVYASAPATAGPIQAQMNIFGTSDPTTVIFDHNNNASVAAVVATNQLSANAAYVETLYLDFLHRAGDVNNPSDAGSWVTLLNQATPAMTVATAIVRSAEALGIAVDGLYHRFLGRDADAAGRAGFVSYLQAGGTLESVSQTMLASPEYQSRFPTDASFVQSLYQNLLHRTPSTAEVNSYLALLPQVGRAGVAAGFLSSPEFRGDEVMDDYIQLLHRTPSPAEVNGWVGSNLDLLSIDAFFAASPEFQFDGY
jgi:hypothetical protein